MDNKRTLIEEAYQQIKDMIFHQQLVPGQKLVYSELSKSCHMSQTPIINSLFRLEHEGFVESIPFRGFYVKKIDVQEAWDLFGVREALETYLVEQVIHIVRPADLLALEQKFKAHASYQPRLYDRKRFKLDSEFHIHLASMSGNQVLTRQLSHTLEHFYIRFRFDNMDVGRLQSSVAEHRRIIDRIRNKDIPGSREAIRNHIQNARDSIISSLGGDGIAQQM